MGRRMMYYCIDYRNMHTGIHGLIVYNTRNDAENAYEKFKAKERDLEKSAYLEEMDKEDYEYNYEYLIRELFEKSISNMNYDEIDYRNIKEIYKVNKKGEKKLVRKYDEDKIICNLVSLDLYL